MPLSNFTPDQLVCLANKLKRQFEKRDDVAIAVFSDASAAKLWPVFGDTLTVRTDLDMEIHAYYVSNRKSNENYIELMPMGFSVGKSFNTRIGLPIDVKPQCNVKFADRCLLGIREPRYAPEARKGGAAGIVDVRAVFDPAGTAKKITITSINVHPEEYGVMLAAVVEENLKTWQLERGKDDAEVAVEYSFKVNPSLRIDQSYDEFRQPNEIAIVDY